MEIIFREGNAQRPRVILDKENNKFEISGHSLPEDAISFYSPILSWLDEYSKTPNENTEFTLKMIYYNTASSKVIYEIFARLSLLNEQGHNIKVKWYYAEDDEDMEEAGHEFAGMVDLPFEFIPYPPE
jgi:hypothetical protein